VRRLGQCSGVSPPKGQSGAASGLAAVLERCVAAMQHQRIPVGVAERGHVAHAGVERVAVELHTPGFELGSRGGNIRNPQRKPRWARGEWLADARRVSKQFRVETLRPSDVCRKERHEIHSHDMHGHRRRA
jgi:hypothetical protein